MGLPGRTSLARVLLLSVVLSGLALGPARPRPGLWTTGGRPTRFGYPPVRGPIPAGAGSFVPGRVLVGFEAGAGERGRQAAAAAVDGQGVVISRPGGAQVRVLRSGPRAAGRQRVGWTGRTSSDAWVRGRFWYVIEATDAAGNTSRSARHQVQVR